MYNGMMKFCSSKLLFTFTADQSNLMSLVKRIIDGRNFITPEYARTSALKKLYLRN